MSGKMGGPSGPDGGPQESQLGDGRCACPVQARGPCSPVSALHSAAWPGGIAGTRSREQHASQRMSVIRALTSGVGEGEGTRLSHPLLSMRAGMRRPLCQGP